MNKSMRSFCSANTTSLRLRGLIPLLWQPSRQSAWLPFIEPAEAGALDCRDVDKHIFAAALRLDEAVTLGRIEPFNGTCRHLSLLQSSIAAAGI